MFVPNIDHFQKFLIKNTKMCWKQTKSIALFNQQECITHRQMQFWWMRRATITTSTASSLHWKSPCSEVLGRSSLSSWMVLARTWWSSSLAWCTATTGNRALRVTTCGKILCAGDSMLASVFSSNSSVSPSLLASSTWSGLRTHQLQAGQACSRCHARQLASVLLLLDPLHS